MKDLSNSAKLKLSKTGLKKSIFDATISFRDFLKRNGIHDYSEQAFGSENKVKIEIKLYKKGYPFASIISFYRSRGRGDCRVSIAEINNIARPGDQILFTIENGQLLCQKIDS